VSDIIKESAGPVVPAALSSAADARRIDIRELLRLLNRRKWQLAGVTILVCVLTGLVLSRLTQEYRATALVMLDSRKAKITNTTDVLSSAANDIPAIQTEIEVLRSTTLLGRVSDKLHLDQDAEYGAAAPSAFSAVWQKIRDTYVGWAGGAATPSPATGADGLARQRAIAALGRNLLIATRGRSYVIAVAADSTDPAKAKRIVDTITDFYIVDQLQAKLDANKRATEFFNDRLDELKRTVETAESAVARYREKAGLTIGKDSTIASQSLSELNSQLVQARALRADKESRLIALKEAARSPATLGGVTEVLANPLISSLRAQEAEVARRIGDLNQRYGENHPRLLQARAEQGQIQARIGAEVSKILGSLQGDAEAAKSKETELQSQVDRLEQKAGGLGQSEVQLRQLEREAQSSRAVYEDFLKRFKELREQQDIQQPDARVLSAATVPNVAVYPRYGLSMSLAGIAGLMLGLVLIGVVERLDGGFRTGDQIERFLKRPLIGMIPSLSAVTLNKMAPARFAISKPNSAYAEALRSTFTAIKLGSLDRPPKVIMITSSLPGEGKSTFAGSLAGLLAKANPGARVILLDCDLRRSSLIKSLRVPETEGTIDEYLSGTKPMESVIGLDAESGLYYVPARANTPNSAEILSSNAMRNFIKVLCDKFDYVLLDTPPLMAVSDARLTAQIADYVVFLVRWETTVRELAVNSLRLLREGRASVGVVLSQVNIRRHARYGYGDYGYYYSKYRDYYTS
jgi:exopolysaccharide transport family protein